MAQVATTLAGGGPNGVQATAANLPNTTSVAFDQAGNYFVASSEANRVFRVDLLGTLTVVAGNGSAGFSGDGGAATNASLALNGGYGIGGAIALDPGGNLFIADTNNHRVRRVDATTRIITTVAGAGTAGFSGDGGAATGASLNAPRGVALDATGNLLIADSGNNRIRRVAATTGIITTVAGDGTAGFSGDGGAATIASLNAPYGAAFDATGNFLFADTGNHRIRRVAAATGVITTVAGNGTAGFSGDGGAATGASLYYPRDVAVDVAGNLFVGDGSNNRIRRVDAKKGIITTVAGSGAAGFSGDGGAATGASLNDPWGVALDAAGNLLFADRGNLRVRRVDAKRSIITTVAGNGTVGFSGDGGAATGASLDWPRGVARDAAGNVYIADATNNRIRRVDATTGIITTVAGNGTAGFSGDGGAATAASLSGPRHIALDAGGNLFIADSSNNRIRRVDRTTGTITTIAGNGTVGFAGDGGAATGASLNWPRGVGLDRTGNLFIADSSNNLIRRVDATTGIITTVAGNGTAGFSGDGGAATGASLNWPYAVALDATGNLFIADSSNNLIRRVDATTGIITTVAGNGTGGFSGDGGAATGASLNAPYGVAADASGNLLIADTGNNRIRRVAATTGVITTVAGTGAAGFSGDGGAATSASLNWPGAVAVDATGNVFVIADSYNNRIRGAQ